MVDCDLLKFLHSRYPPRYIHSRFAKFLCGFLAPSAVLPMIEHENDFATVRRQLLTKPTASEHQIASRLAKTMDTEANAVEVVDPLVEARLRKESKWDTQIIVHYTHEQRLSSCKRDIHQLWNDTFRGTPASHTRLIIGNRNSCNLAKQLVKRRSENAEQK